MAEETMSRRTASRSRGEGGGGRSRSKEKENGAHPGGGRSKRAEQRSQGEKPGSKAGKSGRGGQEQQGGAQPECGPLSRGLTSVKSAGSSAVGAVAENPVPAALIGAGLAWLLVQSAGRRHPEIVDAVASSTRDALGTVGEGVSTATGTVKNALSTTAETVKEGASTVGQYTKSGLSTAAGAIGSGASAVGRGAKKGVTATKDAVVSSWQNHPVLTSAAALAAGVAVAMMVPSTGPERKAMGKRSAATTGRAKSAAKEFL